MTLTARLLWILAFVTLLGAPAGAGAAEWARFRGPNGTGVSDDADVPVEFGPDLNRRWKVELPGTGNASPIVSKGKIFLQAVAEEGSRVLVCLDLETGETLWTRTAPGGQGHTHPKNTLASNTAAADGERIYVPFWDGSALSLSAYDYDGELAWTYPLGEFTSQHGAGHSPIVVGNKVILVNDQDGTSEVIALNARSGGVAWKMPRQAFRACYSTPLVVEGRSGRPEVLVASTAGASTYDAETGSETWSWQWATNDKELRTVGSPIVSEGLAFFSGGNGPGARHAVAVNLRPGTGGGDNGLAWETRKLFPYVPCMLARGEHLYFINDSGIAGCFVARTGEEVWTRRLDVGDVTASPLLINGKVYAISEKGSAVVFAAETDFELLSRSELEDTVRATPAAADGRLLVRGQKHLYCFAKSSVGK